METSRPSVVFFGAGPVAAASLELLAKNFYIEAVVTKAKPEGHRGEYPTLTVAKKLNVPIFTPANKHELSQFFESATFASNVGIVIDYGIIITQDVIDYFAKGIINSHFSLLPQWRGADPITFAILSGQSMTGVSLMLITAGLDEGPLLAQTEVTIDEQETTDSLTNKLIEYSDGLLQVVLPKWLEGSIAAADQLEVTMLQDNTPSYSRKLTKQDGQLDWNKSAEALEREVRAYKGWPKSYASLNGIDVVVTQASCIEQAKGAAGEIWLYPEQKLLCITCGSGSLCIQKLKPAGKAEMDSTSFINGYGKQLFKH